MAEPSPLRLFVAVDVNDGVRRLAGRIQDELRPVAPGVRWVAPELCHLTLKFLGWVPPERAPTIAAACSSATEGQPDFTLAFGGVGAFPNWRRPRVVWLGITAGVDELGRLQQRVERALNAVGFAPEERAFSPHLTLGRFRESPARASADRLSDLAVAQRGTGRVDVRSVQLMRSVLRPTGPEYSVLERFPLGGAGP